MEGAVRSGYGAGEDLASATACAKTFWVPDLPAKGSHAVVQMTAVPQVRVFPRALTWESQLTQTTPTVHLPPGLFEIAPYRYFLPDPMFLP